MRPMPLAWLAAGLALAALTACGGGGGEDDADGDATTPPAATGDATTGAGAGSEFCQDLPAAFGPVAEAYDDSLRAVNDAYRSGDPDAVAETVAELQDDAASLAGLLQEQAGTVPDTDLAAALNQAVGALDDHVAAIVALDVDDYGDPELTPDGVAFQDAVRRVLTHCE